MRIFSIQGTKVTELAPSSAVNPFETLSLPASGYLWLSCTRSEFELHLSAIQATLHRLCSLQLVDLHVSDLLNSQLPSRYDFTSLYDVLVFRRLAAGKSHTEVAGLLRKGRPVDLAVQYDGGTVKIVGLPREQAA